MLTPKATKALLLPEPLPQADGAEAARGSAAFLAFHMQSRVEMLGLRMT